MYPSSLEVMAHKGFSHLAPIPGAVVSGKDNAPEAPVSGSMTLIMKLFFESIPVLEQEILKKDLGILASCLGGNGQIATGECAPAPSNRPGGFFLHEVERCFFGLGKSR